jgi:hypothetical protein
LKVIKFWDTNQEPFESKFNMAQAKHEHSTTAAVQNYFLASENKMQKRDHFTGFRACCRLIAFAFQIEQRQENIMKKNP